jgi:DNA-binding GntR family transcriptional regulator
VLSRTLPTQAAEVIRERILSGHYSPGARILETDLAKEFQISRNTLRTALQALAFEGLLVQNQFKNTHVPLPHSEDVFETYTLRNALEAMACRLAAERAQIFGTRTLDETLRAMSDAVHDDDRKAVVAADFAFHAAVIELAGHTRLGEHYGRLHAQTRLFLNLTAGVDYELIEIERLHRELGDAIRRGDGDLAERLGGKHNTDDGERLCQVLRERERLETP